MSQAGSKVSFQKPWLSHADQVQVLRHRGLLVADVPAAEQFLSHLNYYRFSGYCLAFEVQRHQFIPGTTFEQITRSYQFDLTLRDLLTEALEVIEVDLRATIAYAFGQQHQAFGHSDSALFFHGFLHQPWLDQVRQETQRSNELFVTHFQHTYKEYPDLPVWIVTEVMSFGCLSRMLAGMRRADQRLIAHRYGLQPNVLCKVMHHLVYVRNLCAHHSRIWDRVWSIKPQLPAGSMWQQTLLPGNNRLFASLLLIRRLLSSVSAIKSFADEWRNRVSVHLAAPPASPYPLLSMGLTEKWNQHPLWV